MNEYMKKGLERIEALPKPCKLTEEEKWEWAYMGVFEAKRGRIYDVDIERIDEIKDKKERLRIIKECFEKGKDAVELGYLKMKPVFCGPEETRDLENLELE